MPKSGPSLGVSGTLWSRCSSARVCVRLGARVRSGGSTYPSVRGACPHAGHLLLSRVLYLGMYRRHFGPALSRDLLTWLAGAVRTSDMCMAACADSSLCARGHPGTGAVQRSESRTAGHRKERRAEACGWMCVRQLGGWASEYVMVHAICRVKWHGCVRAAHKERVRARGTSLDLVRVLGSGSNAGMGRSGQGTKGTRRR